MIRSASAVWQGSVREGKGSFKGGSGLLQGSYSFPSRFENGPGSNPEELLGAAHAACFSMALAAGLGAAGFTPTRVATEARVTIEKKPEGFRITGIELVTEVEAPGLDDAGLQQHAQVAKQGCPLSVALTSVPITLTARLIGG
jgi:osmotically inducible protein OsmC